MNWEVAGLGNAIMDALVVAKDDAILDELGLNRGTMHPVDHDAWMKVFDKVQHFGVTYESGGSCANTIATLGRLGANVIYCGRVGDDDLGERYAACMADACGRHALRVAEGASTGKCLSIVSEADAERTMVTDLGASIGLSDLGDFGQVLDSVRIAHFTGYTLLGGPMVPIVLDAMRSARDSGALVSLDVADPFVVQAIRDRLWEVIDDFADIVFLNADEARALTDAEPEEAVSIVADRANVRTVVVKLGAQGSIVSHEGKIHRVEAKMVRAIDTTGAGDAYAGGFLYGYLRSWDATRCGDLASAVAAETVSQLGAVVNDRARLDAVLSQFVGQETSGAEA